MPKSPTSRPARPGAPFVPIFGGAVVLVALAVITGVLDAPADRQTAWSVIGAMCGIGAAILTAVGIVGNTLAVRMARLSADFWLAQAITDTDDRNDDSE